MNKPLVSIVIPLFNKSDWIIPTLRSVLNQEYVNWECIIVDDGSTDNSLDLVSNFIESNSRNWRIIKQPNSGQAVARNLGISLSHGKYIAMLDADDIWFTDKLLKQVSFLETNPEVDLLYCSYVIFEESLRKNLRIVGFMNSKKMVKKWLQMLGFGGLIESVSLIRTDLFKNIGMFDPELSTSSGLDIAIKASLFAKTAVLRDVLVGYRISDNQWHKNCDELVRNSEYLNEKFGDLLDSKVRVMNYQKAYLSYNLKRESGLVGLLVVFWSHVITGNIRGIKMFFALSFRNLLSHVRGLVSSKRLSKEIANSQSTVLN